MKTTAAWLAVLFLCTLGVVTDAHAKGVPIGQATPEQKESAKQPYIDGRAAFDEGNFEEALKQFKASYDIVASPNSHHMMAMAMRELGQLAIAYEHFGEVAAEAEAASAIDEKYKKAAENARTKRSELMERLGFVLLDVSNPDGAERLTIKGRNIERSRWTGPIAVDPGPTTVEVKTTAGGTLSESLNVVAGQSHDVKIVVPTVTDVAPEGPVELDEGGSGIKWVTPWRIGAYAVAGAGVLSFAIAIGLGSAAQSQFDDLEAACGTNPCPQMEDDISSGEGLQVGTNVMLVMGTVLVLGGGALWWFAPDAQDDDDQPDTGSVYVAPLPGGVLVGGTF